MLVAGNTAHGILFDKSLFVRKKKLFSKLKIWFAQFRCFSTFGIYKSIHWHSIRLWISCNYRRWIGIDNWWECFAHGTDEHPWNDRHKVRQIHVWNGIGQTSGLGGNCARSKCKSHVSIFNFSSIKSTDSLFISLRPEPSLAIWASNMRTTSSRPMFFWCWKRLEHN